MSVKTEYYLTPETNEVNMQVIVQVLLDVLLLSFISLSNQMNAWGCCLLSKQYVDKEDAVCKVKVSMGPLDKYITKQTLMSLLNKQRGVRRAVLYCINLTLMVQKVMHASQATLTIQLLFWQCLQKLLALSF